MGREEQIEEREVLESIFPDEITDISETEYRIAVKLDIPPDENGKLASVGEEDGEGEEDEQPVMFLTVRYPEDYPDREPHLDLTAPQNATSAQQHPLFSVAEDKEALLAGLRETARENLGMAMVFTLVTTLKEEAEQLVVSRREAAARAREEALLAAEREENKKFHGTPVTPETFARWREGFLREMEERRAREEEERLAELKKARVREPARLTGRQLWERGLVGKVEEDAEGEVEEEEEDGVVGSVEKLKIEA